MLSMMAMASAMSPDVFREDDRNEKREPLPVIPPPPKGTKEYFFNEAGEFDNHRMLRTELVFKCFAINFYDIIFFKFTIRIFCTDVEIKFITGLFTAESGFKIR